MNNLKKNTDFKFIKSIFDSFPLSDAEKKLIVHIDKQIIDDYGLIETLHYIGECYMEGKMRVEKNQVKAAIFLEQASLNYHLPSKLGLIKLYTKDGTYRSPISDKKTTVLVNEIYDLVYANALKGLPFYQYTLGIFIKNGFTKKGILDYNIKHWINALEWFKKSADQGFYLAKNAFEYVSLMLEDSLEYKKMQKSQKKMN